MDVKSLVQDKNNKTKLCVTFCRRLLFTADPQYPAVTVSAKLPSLVLHINEHKVHGPNWFVYSNSSVLTIWILSGQSEYLDILSYRIS